MIMRTDSEICAVVAHAFATAERSITVAMKDTALLVADLCDSSIHFNLAAEVSQPVIDHAARSLTALASGQEGIALQAHRRVAAIARSKQLETDWGGPEKKPNAQASDRPQLSAVV